MRFTILQENLAKAVNTASRFASSKAQLPVLGNILISAQKTKILICSTNLEISVAISVGAKVEEEGEINVPAKVLNEMVLNLPKETLSFSSEKEQLKISAANFSSTILGMNSADFPKVPSSVTKEKAVAIAKDDLISALSQVIFASSTDETRPVLTGVLFIWEKRGLTLVATDGFRLSRREISSASGHLLPRIILPKNVLTEIARAESSEEDFYVDLREKDKQIVFGLGDTILSSRLLEGEYPDFERILPKSSSLQVLCDKEELLRTVKLASVFARESANIVRVRVLKDSVKVSAESSTSGNQEAKIDAKVDIYGGESAEPFEIAFNYRFLEEFLQSVKGEEVKMEFSGQNSPGVFTDTNNPAYLHLIMPVRTQS